MIAAAGYSVRQGDPGAGAAPGVCEHLGCDGHAEVRTSVGWLCAGHAEDAPPSARGAHAPRVERAPDGTEVHYREGGPAQLAEPGGA